MTTTKNFYFRDSSQYTLNDSLATEITDGKLRLKDTGEYYSDRLTILLMHFNESAAERPINSANYADPEDLVSDTVTWAKILDPRVPAASDYKFKYYVSSNSVVFGKGACNGNSLLALYNGTSANADEALGTVTAVPNGVAPVVEDNCLKCAGTGSISYSIIKNCDFTNIGTIRFSVQPNYDGAPSSDMPLFSIPGVADSGIYLYQEATSGDIFLKLVDTEANVIENNFGNWVSEEDEIYEFTVQINTTAGTVDILINGSPLGTTWTFDSFDRSVTNLVNFNIGDSGDFEGSVLYYDGNFHWLSLHRNFIAEPEGSEPSELSRSGSLVTLGSLPEYPVYYDPDSEILGTSNNRIILKIINDLPSIDESYDIEVVSVSLSIDGFSTAYHGVPGLFNTNCFSYDGISSFSAMYYSTAMDIADDTAFSIDVSLSLDSLGPSSTEMFVTGNLDSLNKKGFGVTVSSDLSYLRIYKGSMTQYATAIIPPGIIRPNTIYRLSIGFDPAKGSTFDPSDQPVKAYLDKTTLDISYGNTNPLSSITGITVIGCTVQDLEARDLVYTYSDGTRTIYFSNGTPVSLTAVESGEILELVSDSVGSLIVKITDPSLLPRYSVTESVVINANFDTITYSNSIKPYYIGSLDGTSLFYKGKIEELRVSKTLRSLSEITNEHYYTGTFYADMVRSFSPGNLINWSGFDAQEILSGNTYFTYQFSSNNGASFFYYDTTGEDWVTAGSLSDSNTADELTVDAMMKLSPDLHRSLSIRIIMINDSIYTGMSLNYLSLIYNALPIIRAVEEVTYELSEISSTNIEYISRYSKAQVYKYDEDQFVDGRFIPVMRNHLSDTNYVVSSFDNRRLDLISLDLYGTIEYWWILADLNNIFNPFEELPLGYTLKVPTLSRIGAFYATS